MAYTLEQIRLILGAGWLKKNDAGARIEQLLLDSRSITAPAGCLFFALPGQRHDGHRFVADAYRAGVRHFVVSRRLEGGLLPEANILLVPDTLAALQMLASWHRRQFKLPVIGITGSNGKTIVKEWLSLLAHHFRIVLCPKSYK